MNSRRYPTALEVEMIMWYLERPMTMRSISRETGIRYDRVRYGMSILRYRGLVRCRRRSDGGALWSRRRRHV